MGLIILIFLLAILLVIISLIKENRISKERKDRLKNCRGVLIYRKGVVYIDGERFDGYFTYKDSGFNDKGSYLLYGDSGGGGDVGFFDGGGFDGG